MCVYYGSITKTINAKNSLNHSRYLSNAENIIQSLRTFVGITLIVFLLTWVHTILRTSTLRRDEGLFESVLSIQLSMYKPVTGNASCNHGCVHAKKSVKNKICPTSLAC